MLFSVADETGAEISFECDDSLSSRWTCGAILEGRTYPHLPFVGQVDTVLDVGANCGAATVHFTRWHPQAVVHAFEPGTKALGLLRRNTEALAKVAVHPFGLSDADRNLTLFLDAEDLGMSTTLAPRGPVAGTEEVELLAAGPWAQRAGVTRIDLLKVDVEGCEVAVIESLGSLVADAKVIYVEYDGRAARRRLAELLEPTHELYLGQFLTLDQGECVYLRKDLADHPGAIPRLRELFTRSPS